MKQQLNEIKRLQKLASIKINESVLSVSDLDYEPTLEIIKQAADRLGLEWNNVSQASVKMYSDTNFKVMNIPKQSIDQFNVSLSDDESEFIIDAPNTAQITIPNSVFESSLQEFKTDIKEEDSTDSALSMAYKEMKSGLSALKGYKAEKPKNEGQLNESVTAMVVSGLLAAPKIIEWIGKGIGFLVKSFSKKDESSIGKSIEKFGHKWEKFYMSLIKGAIKLTGFLESNWKKGKEVDEEKLELIAKVIFAVILAVAAGNALKTVLSPASPAIKAIEATFGGIKAAEIATIAKTVANKLGINIV
jgi:hypothetical protein